MSGHISIFFDGFHDIKENKISTSGHIIPTQIILGLIDIGWDADLITRKNKNYSSDCDHPFSIIYGDDKDFTSVDFWKRINSDTVLFYFGMQSYKKHFRAIKSIGKKIILKLDSDGKIWYPLHYFNSPCFEMFGSLYKRIGRAIKWSIPYWREKSFQASLYQFEMADAIIVESPDALNNVVFLLNYWKRSDLISKIHFVANPVTNSFSQKSPLTTKKNQIIAIGRWNEEKQKNPELLISVLVKFLNREPSYTAKIIGENEILKKILSKYNDSIKERIELIGTLPHDKIKSFLESAKILLVSSRWESFCLVAAEALCCGCSFVSTPLEPLRYLSMQGFSGETAINFSEKAVFSALLLGAEKWRRGDYDPEKISSFWRERLDRKNIANKIIRIVGKFKI